MERLYALALALVPDSDVAGDLFMEARNEADLLKRAERWRRRHGLPDLAVLPSVPGLTPEQAEHAAHLLRRAALRRSARRALGAVAGALLVGLLLLGRSVRLPALEVDPVFLGDSVAVSDEAAGLQVEVYRVEATPGAVTLWWAITGSDAAQKAKLVTPELALRGIPSGAWSRPASSEVSVHRSNRVLIRSVYPLFAPSRAEAAALRFREGEQVQESWGLAVPLERRDGDELARTFAINREATFGPYIVRLVTMTISPYYTSVRYLADFADEFPFVALETGGDLLLPQGIWQAGNLNPGEQEVVFPALPHDTDAVSLLFSPRGWHSQSLPVQVLADGGGRDWRVSDWRLADNRLEAVVTTSERLVLAGIDGAALQAAYLGRGDHGTMRWRIEGPAPENPVITLRFAHVQNPILKLPVHMRELD